MDYRQGNRPAWRAPRLGKLSGLSVVLLLASGCASRAGDAPPAWPEQSSPAYPEPDGSVATPAPAVDLDTADAKPNREDTEGTSQLAKQYQGKKPLQTLRGKATYYADSLAGNHTANGDVYDPKALTAAHKKLPFGTIARVIREDTGKITYVRINDRGPFGSADRIIDLSKAAARELDMLRAGVVAVRVEIVDRPATR